MTAPKTQDLRDALKDAHAHFFLLKGEQVTRLALYEIRPDAIVIEMPVAAPMRRSLLGLIPTLDGSAVYEIEGAVEPDPLPDQMPGTLRLRVDPKGVRRVNRRLFPRVSFTPPIPGEIAIDGISGSIACRVVNFSAGGVRVETSEELPAGPGFIVRFEIELEEEVHALSPHGRIVYEMPLERGFAYGVKFSELSQRAPGEEASVFAITQTADLIALVNRLLIQRSRAD